MAPSSTVGAVRSRLTVPRSLAMSSCEVASRLRGGLPGAEIGGNLECSGGTFKNAGDFALNCDGARITRSLYLRGGVRAEGTVSFSLAHARDPLDDDVARGSIGIGDLILDGFTYERIAGSAPTDAKTRVGWLMRQRKTHTSSDFRPQPFEQLAKVLAAMGHDGDARKIAIAKQKLMIPVRVRDAPRYARPFVRMLWELHGATSGFGYRPSRLVVILLGLWLAGGLFYTQAADFGVFAPADRQVRADATLRMCRQNWSQCDAANIAPFRPFAYSADNLLPAIDLGQRKAWVVSGWVGTLVAIQSLLGVVGALLFGAIVTGLIKKD